MAWQQSVKLFSATPTIGTYSPAVTPGQTVLLLFGWGDAVTDTATITDNASGGSNTYTQIGSPVLVNSEYWGIAYCLNVLGSPTSITMSTVSAHATGAIIADVYDGGWTFNQSSNTGSQPAGTLTPPALTPPVNGCLIYGTAVNTGGNGVQLHPGNGFTARIINFTSAWATGDLTQTSAAPVSATFDILTSPGIAFEMVLTPAGSIVSAQSQGSAGGSILRVVQTIGY